MQYLEKAIELVPEDPTINDHLGDAYWRNGRLIEARYQWRRALQFGPQDDEIKPIQAKIEQRAERRRPPQGGRRRLSRLEPRPVAVSAVRPFAPAKVNLYLHVVGRRADGYHLLDSLVAFADIGDRLTAGACRPLSLTVGGPEAGALAVSATTIWCCAPPGSVGRARRHAAPPPARR